MFPSITRSTQVDGQRQGISTLARLVARPAVSVPVLLLLVAIPHAFTLLNLVQPDLDDAWYASRAWAVIQTGWAYGPLDQGVFNNFEGYWTYFGLIGNYIVAASVLLFGPTIFAVRIVSLAFGIALLALCYIIARKLFSHKVGILSILTGAFTLPFISGTHIGRQDVFVATFAFGALALYLYQSDDRLSIGSFISGLLLGLSLDVHLPGIIFPPMIAAITVFDYRWKVFRVGRAWGMLAGFCCVALYYVVVHILPFPQTYSEISRMQQGSAITTLPISRLDPSIWWSSIVGLRALITPTTMVISAIALIILLYKPRHADRRFAVLFFALLCACVSLLHHKVLFYAILLGPLVWILMGASLEKVLTFRREHKQRRVLYWAGTTFIIVSLLGVSLPSLSVMLTNNYPNHEAAMRLVRESTLPGKSILGIGPYWFARPDQPFYSWQQLIYHKRYQPNSDLEDAFRTLNPDYLIMDRSTDSFLFEEHYLEDINAYGNVGVSKREMTDFLNTHAILIAETTNLTFGHIRIYEINW